MAIKTNIDHIDNVKEIKGFISYQDYVNLDCYQNYVKANGISPTDNTLSYIREKEKKQTTIMKRKRPSIKSLKNI